MTNTAKRLVNVAILAAFGGVTVVAPYGAAASAVRPSTSVLPNGWLLEKPHGLAVQTGTMPQGAALSPDGTTLAVVESGFNPAALRLYSARDLHAIRRVALDGAFGRPAWRGSDVLVAGANADAIFAVDARTGSVRKIRLPAKSYPVAVAVRAGVVAVATDGDGALRIGDLDALAAARPARVGSHPGGVAFAPDGADVFVAVRSASTVAKVSVKTGAVSHIPTGLHPAAVLVRGRELYVAEADADTVGVFDTASGRRIAAVFLGIAPGGVRRIGASPNALATLGDRVFVSLGAANQIAVLRNHRLAARLATGWYPTDVVPAAGRLLVIDGKGEGTKANPDFNFRGKSFRGYVAAIQFGSIRNAMETAGSAAPVITKSPLQTVVRAGGPIQHVFFILKENRSYDQVLGDMPGGNGDRRLVWFGRAVTPNQHAIAARFGLFDNAYASGEVSSAGHNWADGAFANDYVERFWPILYGGRRDLDDLTTGIGAGVPAAGYIWQAARAAHVSFRDYGELIATPPDTTAPSLRNEFDARYVGWDLNYSDLGRVKEWRRELNGYLNAGAVPQFEFIWLPNDHTSGSRPGKPTPAAYVATNDYAVGLIVQAISHSRIWRSSAIFAIEDDAQDGADHVSDQRTTLYLASPYARSGPQHAHYSTVSVLRTIELMLGMQPLSAYDATAAPMYAAFGTHANLKAYDAIAPQIDTTARNTKVAFGADSSLRADFTRPDAAPPGLLRAILAHNHQALPVRHHAGASVAYTVTR